jgi:uncharacterized protein
LTYDVTIEGIFMTNSRTIHNTIKIIAACAIFYWSSGTIHAQTTDAKRQLAARAIAAQDGPEMNNLLVQIAGSATQQVMANWNERVEQLPAAKQQTAITALDAELKKFNDDALKLITAQANKVRADALLNAYAERFSEDELKQLVALMEAPAYKKYQAIAPELGNVYIKAIVDGTRNNVIERGKSFDAAAIKIVGSPAAAQSAPAKKKP